MRAGGEVGSIHRNCGGLAGAQLEACDSYSRTCESRTDYPLTLTRPDGKPTVPIKDQSTCYVAARRMATTMVSATAPAPARPAPKPAAKPPPAKSTAVGRYNGPTAIASDGATVFGDASIDTTGTQFNFSLVDASRASNAQDLKGVRKWDDFVLANGEHILCEVDPVRSCFRYHPSTPDRKTTLRVSAQTAEWLKGVFLRFNGEAASAGARSGPQAARALGQSMLPTIQKAAKGKPATERDANDGIRALLRNIEFYVRCGYDGQPMRITDPDEQASLVEEVTNPERCPRGVIIKQIGEFRVEEGWDVAASFAALRAVGITDNLKRIDHVVKIGGQPRLVVVDAPFDFSITFYVDGLIQPEGTGNPAAVPPPGKGGGDG